MNAQVTKGRTSRYTCQTRPGWIRSNPKNETRTNKLLLLLLGYLYSYRYTTLTVSVTLSNVYATVTLTVTLSKCNCKCNSCIDIRQCNSAVSALTRHCTGTPYRLLTATGNSKELENKKSEMIDITVIILVTITISISKYYIII